jgi:thiol:disulfide interchange protein DsbD
MLAYSTAFAAPFFFLALFPDYLARLPKSGSWLVSVKAVMGFLELAAALKFISNVDLVWSLAFLTRPVFLAIWAAIGAVCGLYLLGWMRLPHDDGILRVGWPRRCIGVLSIIGSVWCLAAMNGASLGQLNAFLPPDPYPGQKMADNRPTKWLDNYDEALAQAKATKKALFINFTGAT